MGQPTGRELRLFNLNPKSASFYSEQASSASRLSIVTRTPQYTGPPPTSICPRQPGRMRIRLQKELGA
jgi:hypothetical protein